MIVINFLRIYLRCYTNNNDNNNYKRILQQDNLSTFTNIVIIRVLLAYVYNKKRKEKCQITIKVQV